MFIINGKRAPPRLPHVGDGIDLNQVIFISLCFPSNRPTPLRREQTAVGSRTTGRLSRRPTISASKSNSPRRQGSAALPQRLHAAVPRPRLSGLSILYFAFCITRLYLPTQYALRGGRFFVGQSTMNFPFSTRVSNEAAISSEDVPSARVWRASCAPKTMFSS